MKDYAIADHSSIMETLILQIRDLLMKIKNSELRKHGITIRQYAVLDIVNIMGNKITPSEISVRLLRQPHTISSLLIRMEKQGLVTRTKNPDIKSSVNIALTPKGLQLLNKARDIDSTRDLQADFTEQELQKLIISLKKLRSNALNKLTQRDRILLP